MAEQEAKVSLLFKQLESSYKQLEKINDDAKSEKKLKEIVDLIKDVKAAVKEYEREARVDGVDAAEIKATRAEMVNTVNKYVSMKKEYSSRSLARQELMGPGAGPSKPQQKQVEDMTNQEIIQTGHKRIKETDQVLDRAVRVVNDTEQIGMQAAQKLKAQTDQMGKIIDDLNEIDFTMKRASKVIRDITRGLLTDKCIMCLLFLVVVAIAAAIGMKIAGVGKKTINLPGPNDVRNSPPPPSTAGRRMLSDAWPSY